MAGRGDHGFQGTLLTKNNEAYGVVLFLNICASYLKAKRSQEVPIKLKYLDPFGDWQWSMGTEKFHCFDFSCPSILSQPNSNDCGLAVVANSMAFINHLKATPFMNRNVQ